MLTAIDHNLTGYTLRALYYLSNFELVLLNHNEMTQSIHIFKFYPLSRCSLMSNSVGLATPSHKIIES